MDASFTELNVQIWLTPGNLIIPKGTTSKGI